MHVVGYGFETEGLLFITKKKKKKINDEMPMSKQVHYQGYNY